MQYTGKTNDTVLANEPKSAIQQEYGNLRCESETTLSLANELTSRLKSICRSTPACDQNKMPPKAVGACEFSEALSQVSDRIRNTNDVLQTILQSLEL